MRKKMQRTLSSICLAGLSALFLSSCGSTSPSRFYVLSSLAEAGEPASARQRIAVRVGPIRLAEHLQNPQIVTRSSPNRLDLAEFDRWAEPLESNFGRVLAENLASLVGDRGIGFSNVQTAADVDYELWMDVRRFDSDEEGKVTLAVGWRFYHGDEIRLSKTTVLTETAADEGFEARVAAMSRALAELSKRIAAGAREVVEPVAESDAPAGS